MNRLTKNDPTGNWELVGVSWKDFKIGGIITKEMFNRLYAGLWKLKEYENTGISPGGVERMAERQEPAEPELAPDNGVRFTDGYRCPNCGGAFTGTGIAAYCYHCGQALKWDVILKQIQEGENGGK